MAEISKSSLVNWVKKKKMVLEVYVRDGASVITSIKRRLAEEMAQLLRAYNHL